MALWLSPVIFILKIPEYINTIIVILFILIHLPKLVINIIILKVNIF